MKYIAAPYYAYSYDNLNAALHFPHVKNSFIVDKLIFYALKRLSAPKTIEELAYELRNKPSDMPPPSDHSMAVIRSGIEDLYKEKLIFSTSDMAELFGTSSPNHNTEINCIAWPTKRNREVLAVSITSAKEMLNSCGRKTEFLVCDDDHESSRIPAMLSHMQESGDALGVSCAYIGKKEKKRFLTTLSKHEKLSGIPEEVLQFLFFGSDAVPGSYGGNRNAVLLAARGKCFISTDDDTVFLYSGRGGRSRGIEFTRNETLNSLQFFRNENEWEDTAGHRRIDILTEYEEILSHSPSEIALAASSGADNGLFLDNISTEMLQVLMNDPQRRVRLCMSGISGDSGLRGPDIIFNLPAAQRESLLKDPAMLDSAASNRLVLRSADRPTISLDGVFMTTQFAADNTGFLPPFFPCGRGEDTVFASLHSLCSGGALQAYLSYGVKHRPSELRTYSEDALCSFDTRCCDFVARIIHYYRSRQSKNLGRERNPSENLRGLARFLIDRCSKNDEHFAAFLTTVNTEYLSQYIKKLEEDFSAVPGPPEFFSRLFNSYRSSLREYLCSGSAAIPSDIQLPVEQRQQCFKQLLAAFGHILYRWPSILEAIEETEFQRQEFLL